MTYRIDFVWLKLHYPGLRRYAYPRNILAARNRTMWDLQFTEEGAGLPIFYNPAHVTAKGGRLAGVG